MPRSKARRKGRPGSRGHGKTRERKARETQTAQREAEEKRKISPGAYRRRRASGWALVVLGVTMAVQHWLHHLGLFTLITPGWDDLVAGYPLGGGLVIFGAIVLSR